MPPIAACGVIAGCACGTVREFSARHQRDRVAAGLGNADSRRRAPHPRDRFRVSCGRVWPCPPALASARTRCSPIASYCDGTGKVTRSFATTFMAAAILSGPGPFARENPAPDNRGQALTVSARCRQSRSARLDAQRLRPAQSGPRRTRKVVGGWRSRVCDNSPSNQCIGRFVSNDCPPARVLRSARCKQDLHRRTDRRQNGYVVS